MARPPTAALLILLTLAAVAPASAAGGLPAPLGATERITGYSWQSGNAWCSPYDEFLGVASMALPSEVTHETVEGGTRYDLHLESLSPTSPCPALDISFVTSIAAWPTTAFGTGAPLTSPCGATGFVTIYAHPQGYHMQVSANLPEACGAGVSGWIWLGASIQPLHPSPYMACVPVMVVVDGCFGAGETSHPEYKCADGQHYSSTYVTWVAYVDRQCDWQTGEGMVVVSPTFGVVWIEARASSCTVVVQDPLLGVVDERAPCPEEVRALLYEADWGNVLP